MITPFLRWAGGKRSQLDQILPLLPKGKRLVETFVGAGSIFMNAGYTDVLVNDLNPDLIGIYQNLVGQKGWDLILAAKDLQKWVNSEQRYLELRSQFNSGKYNSFSKAVFFLVLNRTCFNGLSRYSKNGFNVPWGQKEIPYFPEEELGTYLQLNICTSTLSADFKSVFKLVRKDDTVFCDPPYEPLPGKKGFTTYTGSTFTMDHQRSLVECCLDAQKRGAKVMITNSSAPALIDLYKASGFEIHPLIARRNIAANADTRHDANDIMAILR